MLSMSEEIHDVNALRDLEIGQTYGLVYWKVLFVPLQVRLTAQG